MYQSLSNSLPLSEILLGTAAATLVSENIHSTNLFSSPFSTQNFSTASILGLFHAFLFSFPFNVSTLLCSWRATQRWFIPEFARTQRIGIETSLNDQRGLAFHQSETFFAFLGTVFSALFIIWSLGFESMTSILPREFFQVWYTFEPILAGFGFLLTWNILTSERFLVRPKVGSSGDSVLPDTRFRLVRAKLPALKIFFIHFFLGLSNPAQHWGFGRILLAGPDLFLVGQNSFSVFIYSIIFISVSAFTLLWFWPIFIINLLIFLEQLNTINKIIRTQTLPSVFTWIQKSIFQFSGTEMGLKTTQDQNIGYDAAQAPYGQTESKSDEKKSGASALPRSLGQKLKTEKFNILNVSSSLANFPSFWMSFNSRSSLRSADLEFIFQTLILGTALAGIMQYSWRFITQYSFEIFAPAPRSEISSLASLPNSSSTMVKSITKSGESDEILSSFEFAKSRGIENDTLQSEFPGLRNFPTFDTNTRHRDKNLPVSRHLPVESLNSRRILSNKSALTPEQKSEAYIKWNSNSLNRIQNSFVRQLLLSRSKLSEMGGQSIGADSNLGVNKNLSAQAHYRSNSLYSYTLSGGAQQAENEVKLLRKLKEEIEAGQSDQFMNTSVQALNFEKAFDRKPRSAQNTTKGKPQKSYIQFNLAFPTFGNHEEEKETSDPSSIFTSARREAQNMVENGTKGSNPISGLRAPESKVRNESAQAQNLIFHDDLKILNILSQPSSLLK